jgi:DNA-binding response OmpR family regulator
MKKVLIIDDETNLRKLYQAELTDEGYNVVVAKDGFEGLQLCEKENPRYHCR